MRHEKNKWLCDSKWRKQHTQQVWWLLVRIPLCQRFIRVGSLSRNKCQPNTFILLGTIVCHSLLHAAMKLLSCSKPDLKLQISKYPLLTEYDWNWSGSQVIIS
jgi:hypothetical protein